MKLSFSTLGCPDWSLEQIAQQARLLGYDGVDLRGVAGKHIAPDEPADRRAWIKQLFADQGVQIVCLNAYANFATPDDEERRKGTEATRGLIDVAGDVGCPMVRINAGKLRGLDRQTGLARAAEGIGALIPQAKERGVVMVIESHEDWRNGENLRRLLETINSPQVRICWDIANGAFHEPIDVTFPQIQPFIAHVHFKDGQDVGNDFGKTKLPGQGDIPMEHCLRLLHESGYRGYLCFEWEKMWEKHLDEPEVAFPHFIQFTTALMAKVGVPRG